MQTIRDYFPWEHLYCAPAELYSDFFVDHLGGRIYFPLTLPELRDVYDHSSESGWALLEAVWYHLSGLAAQFGPESSNQVLAAGADSI